MGGKSAAPGETQGVRIDLIRHNHQRVLVVGLSRLVALGPEVVELEKLFRKRPRFIVDVITPG